MSKIIGHGSYGCVYKPPPKCKNNECLPSNPKCVKGVSKLTFEKEAKEEVEHVSMIDKIDPKQIYHIGDPVVCDPEQSFDTSDCSAVENETDLKFLIYDDGGETLINFINLDNIDVVKFIKGFANLFFAIKEMSKHGFVHADIKGNNIVVDKEYNFKLIDFGLSWGTIPISQSEYEYWPPEHVLLGSQNSGDTYKSVVSLLDANKKVMSRNKFVKMLGKDISDEFWEKFSHTSSDETFKIIKSKVDLYSLGIMIKNLYILLIYLSKNDNIASHIENFIKSPPMMTLIKQMLDEDFYERLTPQQAYDRYLIISKKYTECISVYLNKKKLLKK